MRYFIEDKGYFKEVKRQLFLPCKAKAFSCFLHVNTTTNSSKNTKLLKDLSFIVLSRRYIFSAMIKLYKEKKNFEKCPFKLLKDNNNEMLVLFCVKGVEDALLWEVISNTKYCNAFLQLSENSSSYRFNSL